MSTQLHDVDPIETKEWLDALSSVLEYEGSERAQYLLESLVKYSRDKGIRMPHGTTTPYLNTVSVEDEKRHPWRPKHRTPHPCIRSLERCRYRFARR